MKSKTKPTLEAKPLSLKETQEIVLKDQAAVKELVEKSMPEVVAKIKTKEDFYNSMTAAGQEMLLVLEDILVRDFGFDDDKLKRLHNSTRDVLMGIKEYEKHGLSILSPRDVSIVVDQVADKGIVALLGEIAGVRLQKEKQTRIGLEYPTTMGAAPFLKELKKRNKS